MEDNLDDFISESVDILVDLLKWSKEKKLGNS